MSFGNYQIVNVLEDDEPLLFPPHRSLNGIQVNQEPIRIPVASKVVTISDYTRRGENPFNSILGIGGI